MKDVSVTQEPYSASITVPGLGPEAYNKFGMMLKYHAVVHNRGFARQMISWVLTSTLSLIVLSLLTSSMKYDIIRIF